jgi:hypothetical protein
MFNQRRKRRMNSNNDDNNTCRAGRLTFGLENMFIIAQRNRKHNNETNLNLQHKL